MWSNLICRCGHCKALALEVMLLDPAYVSSSPSPIQFRSELVRPALLILSNVHTSLSSMASPNLSSAGSGTASGSMASPNLSNLSNVHCSFGLGDLEVESVEENE